ncbi:hypothetical protein [Winogradskyella sp. PE311]|uniref:hypothetical protein n=1 Tax=Winogradskyella sp. PE311 TaxID=3366943 RepID=UPI003980E98E
MKKMFRFLLIALIVFILKFWIGVYEHDEFGSTHIFIKYRPVWKSYFYSPIGMSDSLLIQFPSEKQIEQILFNEFVSSKGLSK